MDAMSNFHAEMIYTFPAVVQSSLSAVLRSTIFERHGWRRSRHAISGGDRCDHASRCKGHEDTLLWLLQAGAVRNAGVVDRFETGCAFVVCNVVQGTRLLIIVIRPVLQINGDRGCVFEAAVAGLICTGDLDALARLESSRCDAGHRSSGSRCNSGCRFHSNAP